MLFSSCYDACVGGAVNSMLHNFQLNVGSEGTMKAITNARKKTVVRRDFESVVMRYVSTRNSCEGARGQLNWKMFFSQSPFALEHLFLETGSAVPSRIRLFISHTQAG